MALGRTDDEGGQHAATRSLLVRIEARQRESAVILRAHGNERAARQAERAAARVRLTLERPRAVRRMRALAQDVRCAGHFGLALERALEGAMELLGTDLGNVQVPDPATGALRIAAQSGPIALTSGSQAVQSTPLVDEHGRVRGVISTHLRRGQRPGVEDLQMLAWYGELVAAALNAQQRAPTHIYAATAEHHNGAADRHEAVAALMDQMADVPPALRSSPETGQLMAWAEVARERAARERGRARLLAGRCRDRSSHSL